ncbi:MAG: YkgJ family cysteine cluster protein [Pseudomonadota bacterium]
MKYILRALHAVISFLWYCFEAAADWVASASNTTEYVRSGKCLRCGRCCRLLALQVPDYVERHRFLLKAAKWWHDKVLNFEIQGEWKGWLAYRCRNFNEEKKGCGIYHFRHKLCRFYPRPDQFGHPNVHKECGYKFKLRRER